jgi:hypothetical protein
VEHVTKIQSNPVLLANSIADAMVTLPHTSPQTIGYSTQPSARVASGIDTNTPLQTFLTEHALTVIHDIPEPLSATPSSDLTLVTMIANLRAEFGNIRNEHAKRLKHLEAKVDLLLDSTLSVVLHTVLDAHLFQLGFDPRQAQPSCSQFITSHLAALAAALGVDQNQVERIFE